MLHDRPHATLWMISIAQGYIRKEGAGQGIGWRFQSALESAAMHNRLRRRVIFCLAGSLAGAAAMSPITDTEANGPRVRYGRQRNWRKGHQPKRGSAMFRKAQLSRGGPVMLGLAAYNFGDQLGMTPGRAIWTAFLVFLGFLLMLDATEKWRRNSN